MVDVAYKRCADATIDGALGREMLQEGVARWMETHEEEADYIDS